MGGFFNFIAGTIQNQMTYLVDSIFNLGVWIMSGIYLVIQYFVDAAWNTTIGIAAMTVETLFDELEFTPTVDYTELIPYMSNINYYFPLDHMFSVLKMLYAWYVYLYAFSYIRKFIKV